MHVGLGHKYDNFIVGLTNDSPDISTPTLYNYTLCGQYPGAVPNGTTVSLYCQENQPPFRYVIVQIPLRGHLVACEIEVLVRGTRMSIIKYSDIYHSSTHQLTYSMLLFELVSPNRKTSRRIANQPLNSSETTILFTGFIQLAAISTHQNSQLLT